MPLHRLHGADIIDELIGQIEVSALRGEGDILYVEKPTRLWHMEVHMGIGYLDLSVIM